MLSAEDAAIGIQTSNYLVNEETPSWRRLWYRYELPDSEFSKFHREVFADFQNEIFIVEADILHVSGILLQLADEGFLPVNSSQMLQKSKEVVTSLFNAGKIAIDKWESIDYQENSAYGLAYTDCDSAAFVELYEYFAVQKVDYRESQLAAWAAEWEKELTNDLTVWASRIGAGSPEIAWFYNQPIFALSNPQAYCAAFLAMETRELRIVGEMLRKRYKYVDASEPFKLRELAFLAKLEELLSIRMNLASIQSQSAFFLNSYVLKDIRTFIHKLVVASTSLLGS